MAEAGAQAIVDISGLNFVLQEDVASRDACFKAGAIPVLIAAARIHPGHLGVCRKVSNIVSSIGNFLQYFLYLSIDTALFMHYTFIIDPREMRRASRMRAS